MCRRSWGMKLFYVHTSKPLATLFLLPSSQTPKISLCSFQNGLWQKMWVSLISLELIHTDSSFIKAIQKGKTVQNHTLTVGWHDSSRVPGAEGSVDGEHPEDQVRLLTRLSRSMPVQSIHGSYIRLLRSIRAATHFLRETSEWVTKSMLMKKKKMTSGRGSVNKLDSIKTRTVSISSMYLAPCGSWLRYTLNARKEPRRPPHGALLNA